MRWSLAMWCAALVGCGDNYAVRSDAAIDAPPDTAIDARPDANEVLLAMTPSTVAFGLVGLTTTSAPATFTVENTGAQTTGDLTATITGSDPGAFSITSNTCTTVGPDQSCTVTVVCAPTTVGPKAAALTVGDGTNMVVGTMGCSALPPQGFVVSPTIVDFGNVTVGARSAPTVVSITNPENIPRGPLSVSMNGPNPGHFEIGEDGCSGSTLLGGDSCTFEATFVPLAGGPLAVQVMITGGPSAAVTLSGTGLAAELTATPAMKDFGYLGPSGATSDFTVANVGAATSGTIALTHLGDTQFTIVSDACTGMTLAPNATCTFGVRFVPNSPGAKFASIVVAANTGGSVSVIVTGSGVAPEFVIANPSTLDFGPRLVGTTSPSEQITITNPFGTTTGLLSISLGGVSSADFAIANDTCSGTALAPSEACTFNVTFSPTIPGQRFANVTASAIPGGVVSAGLSGTGI